jgi:hypothetical protein
MIASCNQVRESEAAEAALNDLCNNSMALSCGLVLLAELYHFAKGLGQNLAELPPISSA